MVSFYVLCAQISVLVSCHVIRKSVSQRDKNLVWRVVGSTWDSSWHITWLEPLLTVNAVSSSRVVVTLERNILMLT